MRQIGRRRLGLWRSSAFGIAAAMLAAGAACASGTDRPAADDPTPAATASVPASYGPQVVHYAGADGVAFGDLKTELARDGRLTEQVEGCRPVLTAARELGPVFDGERLVLLWVDPPYHTPEGVMVGTALPEARRSYPNAQQLSPPPGSPVFPGLLVTQGDRAYLILHDGQTVQKVVVGFTEHAQRLYRSGFGQC